MRNSELLKRLLDKTVMDGNVPYRANRQALRLLDVEDDGDAGLDEVGLLQRGIKKFVKDLKELQDAARGVAKRATAAIR